MVDSITPKGDPVTKTYRVYFRLPDDTPLHDRHVDGGEHRHPRFEKCAAGPVHRCAGNKVFVVEGDKARRREIKIGIRGTNGVEVLSGIDEKARVVSPYPADLADGARVSVTAPKE